MRRRTAVATAVTASLAGVLVLGTSSPASAHVARTVGAYHFEVGWGSEPTYAGLENSVQLLLSNHVGKPVTNLGDSLKVEVIFGSQKMQFPLVSTFDPDTGEGTPGDYRAWLIPTAPGTYSFHFFGTIGKQRVDERFTSGPTTFDDVADPATVEFPAKIPSGTELAQRIDREIPRLNDAIATVDRQARDRSDSARTFAVVGLAAGAAALVVAVVAVVGWRRASRAGRAARVPSATSS
jgi:hypothetical protein